MIPSLTLWYLAFGRVGAVPLPLGKRPALLGCAAGSVPRPSDPASGLYPLPLPLPQFPGCASLALPSRHPLPSDITRLQKGHPGTRTLPAARWARPPSRSRPPSPVPTRSPGPRSPRLVPGSRQPRACRCCQRRVLAAIQWLLSREWKPGSGCPSTGNPRVCLCLCVPLFTQCQCLHTGVFLSAVRPSAVP